jgi:hypothetical protein
MKYTGLLTLLFLCLWNNNVIAQKNTPLLVEVSAAKSGIDFVNTIRENDSIHIFKYEYLYNGHGIGVADFNKDGLEDLFISGNMVPSKLYLNKGKLRFQDATSTSNLGGNGSWRTGVTIADVNGDTWPDIYICHSGPVAGAALSNELYIHQGLVNGMPVFKEMAATLGVDAPGSLSTHAAFFDYDLDGDLDLFLVNHSNHTVNPYLNTSKIRSVPSMHFGNRLFRNDRHGNNEFIYVDVTLEAGIINNALNYGLSVAISDLNKDGWPDIYTSSDYTEQDYCYINNQHGGFKQVLQQSFGHISKFSMGSDIADVNNDTWPDVFTLDMLPEDNYRQKLLKGPDEYDTYHLLLDSGYYHQQMRNMLHLHRGIDQNGTMKFSEIGQLAGISNTDWSWSSLFIDLDGDGWKDLLVTNGYLRDYTDNDFLKYTVADAQLSQASKGNLNFKTFELVTKMPSNKLKNYLFKNNKDLTFKNVSNDWGFTVPSVSNAAVYADFDNDGDMDLVIGNNNDPVQLFENRARQLLPNNYIQVKLQGKDWNTDATGAKVYVYTSDTSNPVQFHELSSTRGYQSSVSTVMQFGLGTFAQVDSIRVIWTDQTISTVYDPQLNARILIQQESSVHSPTHSTNNTSLFQDITLQSKLDFVHKENDFVDFKSEVLLPYQLSKMGPALATADVNGDGLDDVFIGGALGQPAALFIQMDGARFIRATVQPWENEKDHEDVRAVFSDFNNDGFVDLYVVSGGNEYDDNAPEYRDRIYTNDGDGNFRYVQGALPASMTGSKNSVAFGDVDADGDVDLFVGGGYIPGSFPAVSRSYLLRNDSKDNNLQFTDVTHEWSKDLMYPGMINSIVFDDFNKDGKMDIVLAGEWMPIRIFKNTGSSFIDISGGYGFNDHGLWSSLLVDDINNDGYPDIIAGNVGDNLQFKASNEQPITLIVTDLDDNESPEVLFCYYIQGNIFPAASRDELLDQVVPLRKRFIKYQQYASASLSDIIPERKMQTAQRYTLTELNHIVYLSNSTGKYSKTILPKDVQFSRVFSINPLILPGYEWVYLMTGNFFPWRTQWGQSDAGYGSLLQFKENRFQSLSNQETGLYIHGDVRQTSVLSSSGGSQLLISVKNDAAVQVQKVRQ